MTNIPAPGTGRLAASILGIVLLGTPIVAYLWHALNYLVSGIIRPVELLLAIPVFFLFLGLLYFVGRFVRATEAEHPGSGT
jgi:hypothetical protein